MKLGFIGTGTITAAMVRGLLRQGDGIDAILLSPRNAEVAAELAALDDRITVADSNQAVLDGAGLVVLAIRPQIAEQVLAGLRFRPDHQVLSVMALLPIAKLDGWIGPVARITRATPLPFVAVGEGATAFHPGDPAVQGLIARFSTPIEATSEGELDLFLAGSGLMGTYFGILGEATRTLADQGLEADKARLYLTELFACLSHAAQRAPDTDFAALEREYSTEGGINEQTLRVFRDNGGAQALRGAIDAVIARIRGS